MKENKGVYVTKHDIRGDQLNRNYQFYTSKVRDNRYEPSTRDASVQYNYRRDNVMCTCRNISELRRHQEVRYLSGYPRHIYDFQGSQSFTDIGVGSVKAYQRRKVKRIYLPETDDRGVGSSDLSSFITRKTRYYRTNYYDHKRTSSKCVGGMIEGNVEILNEKLSPIVHTKSGITSPIKPSVGKTKKNVDIGSSTNEKKFVTTTTQIQDGDIKMEDKLQEVNIATVVIENKQTKEMSRHSPNKKKIREGIATSTEAPYPKRISKRAQEAERIFSSDSLVQHVHNLENPSDEKTTPSTIDPMENKLEREYRKIFSSQPKDPKEQKSNEEKPESELKSASVLRRRFEALRRGMNKKDDSKRNAVLATNHSSHISAQTHKDVSVTSDPPSLEAKSYSSTKVYISPLSVDQDAFGTETVYRKSFEEGKGWLREEDDSENQGVKGMFKLWGQKFDLEGDEPGPSTERSKRGKDKIPNSESDGKKESKKFPFFFKKKSKAKNQQQQAYKQKKGVTAGRCEVGDGLMIKIGAVSPAPDTERKKLEKVPEDYGGILRKAWLQQFLTQTIESRPSVKIRWNNKAYATSSSTVFEIMENVYKDTGVIFRSKSEITTGESSFYKSFTKQRARFVQDIQAWMMPMFIPDNATPSLIFRKDEKGHKKDNIEVRISDQKWLIDKSKAFAQKINVVMHSTNHTHQRNDPSSEYLRIDIPKGFFTDSCTSDSTNQMQTSNEEVYKIVEYESPEYNNYLKTNRNIEIGDHLFSDIKVTVSVKDSKEFESKVLETVIKRPPIHRDVVIQGSVVNIPKRCNVIGVGIITQKDRTKLKKPILKNSDDYTDEESETSLHYTSHRFAESYLPDEYRHWLPLGIDFFSWCVSDSHLQCCSENSETTVNNQGDGSKSCPNIYDDYQASAIISSCETSYVHGAPPEDEECKKCNERFVTKFFNKFRTKCKPEPYQSDAPLRVLPKDSLEVFKRRKLYAASMKSQWNYPDDRPYSVPSIASRGAQDTMTECPRLKKLCYSPRKNKPTSKKRVSLPDCDTMNESLANQLAGCLPPGILQYKGSSKCDVCTKKGAACKKHTKVNRSACKIHPHCYGGCQVSRKSSILSSTRCSPPRTPPSPPKSPTRTRRSPPKSPPRTPPSPPKSPPKTRLSPPKSPPKSPCTPPRLRSPCSSPPNGPSSPQRSLSCCGSPKTSGIRLNKAPSPKCSETKRKPPETKQKPPTSKCKKPVVCNTPPCNKMPLTPTSPQPSPPRSPPKRKCNPSPPRCPTPPPRSPSPPRSHRCPSPQSCPPHSPCRSPKGQRHPTPPRSPPHCPTSKAKPSPHNEIPCPSSPPCSDRNKNIDGVCPSQQSKNPSPPHTPPREEQRQQYMKPSPMLSYINSSQTSCIGCRKTSQEFPWPMKNQCSQQSLVPVRPVESCHNPACLALASPPHPLGVESPFVKAECASGCIYLPPVSVPPVSHLPVSPKPSPPNVCKEPQKISGIHLKMKGTRYTCSKECTASQSSTQNNDEIDNDIIINIKKGTASTEDIREGINIKVQDEDGRTLYERCDYTARPSVLHDMYQPNLNQHVSRQIVNNLAIEEKSGTEGPEATSEASVANLIEINFKLKVTQGDKTTEFNIGSDGVTTGKVKDTKSQIGQTSHEVFMLKDAAEQCSEEVDDKNDINIRIIIKNYKPKKNNENKQKFSAEAEAFTQRISDKFQTCAEVEGFPQKISQQFQTITPAYIDVLASKPPQNKEKNEEQNQNEEKAQNEEKDQNEEKAQNEETAQNEEKDQNKEQDQNEEMDQSEENYQNEEKDQNEEKEQNDEKEQNKETAQNEEKEHIEQKENSEHKEQAEKTAEQVFSIHRTTIDFASSNEVSKSHVDFSEQYIAKAAIDLVSSRSATGKSVIEHSESKLDVPIEKESDVESIPVYSYRDKPEAYDSMTESEDHDTTADLKKEIDISDDVNDTEIVGGKLTKEDKKTLMKKVIAKAYKSKKMKSKSKLKQLKDMLAVILTSDSSAHDEIAVTSNELVKEMTYASLKPDYFRDTDSMNNYYKLDSSVTSSFKGSDVRQNVKYPTENISQSSAQVSEDASSDDDGNYDSACGGCLCSRFAAKLNICNGNDPSGACCCNKSEKTSCCEKSYKTSCCKKSSKTSCGKTDAETCCDLRTEEDFFLLNYKTIEYIDVETQNSKYICNSKNISVHSAAISGSFKNDVDVRTVTDTKEISTKFSPRTTHIKPCEMKMLNRNTILGISDEDKVYLMNANPTRNSVRYNVSRLYRESRAKNHRKVSGYYDRPADILQCYETKKAVLEIYAEKTNTEEGEHLVAKLPKFAIEQESDLERNYAEYSDMYRGMEKFVMSVTR